MLFFESIGRISITKQAKLVSVDVRARRKGKEAKGENVMYQDSQCEKGLCKMEINEERIKQIEKIGQVDLSKNEFGYRIHLLNIIGEIEGHQCMGPVTKTTKYEHVLPELARVEEDKTIDGLLVLLNTVGGDVEAGLAIAEMIASLSVPVVTLLLGGGHSIGVPLSVCGNCSFIVPTATMVIHPIRMNGTVLGVKQNYEYIDRMQERIISFTCRNSNIDEPTLKELMFNTTELTKDIGSVLVGKEAVEKGLIDKVGGIRDAFSSLYGLINREKNSSI